MSLLRWCLTSVSRNRLSCGGEDETIMACFGGGNREENRKLGLLGETAEEAPLKEMSNQYGMDIFITQLQLRS